MRDRLCSPVATLPSNYQFAETEETFSRCGDRDRPLLGLRKWAPRFHVLALKSRPSRSQLSHFVAPCPASAPREKGRRLPWASVTRP